MILSGGDEKHSLTLTADSWHRWSTSTTLSFFAGRRRPHWAFRLVDINHTELFHRLSFFTGRRQLINIDCRQATSMPLHFFWLMLTRLSFFSCWRWPDWAFHGGHRPDWYFLVVDSWPRTSTGDAVDFHCYWCFHHALLSWLEDNMKIFQKIILRIELGFAKVCFSSSLLIFLHLTQECHKTSDSLTVSRLTCHAADRGSNPDWGNDFLN